MDIHIKNLDPEGVAHLDERAAAHHMNRSEYLRTVLTAGSMEEAYNEQDGRYKRLIDSMITVIRENTEMLQRVAKELDESERNEF